MTAKNILIGERPAYHSYPDDEEKHPGLIVIEEIWGLNEHIKNVADRFAAQSYSVLAPEILPQSVLDVLTPELQKELFDPAKYNEAQSQLREAMSPIMQPEYAKSAVSLLKQCVDHLLADEQVNGRVAVLGFCFGGTQTFRLAAHDDRVKAALPFYGQPPSEDEIPSIKCPILAFYGEEDERLMPSIPKLKEDMQKSGKQFEAVVYPNAGHAFFNDTNPRTHNPSAAQDAWEKTLAFLKKNVM